MKTKEIKVGEEYAIARSTYATPRQRARVVALNVDRRVVSSHSYSSRIEKNGIELDYLDIETGESMGDGAARSMSYMRPNPARAQNIICLWSEEQASLDAIKVNTDKRRAEIEVAFQRLYPLVSETNKALGASGSHDDGPFFVRGRVGSLSFPEVGVENLEELLPTILGSKTPRIEAGTKVVLPDGQVRIIATTAYDLDDAKQPSPIGLRMTFTERWAPNA